MVTEDPSNAKLMVSVGNTCQPVPVQNLTWYEVAAATSGQSRATVPAPADWPVRDSGVPGGTLAGGSGACVGTGVGMAVGSGAGFGGGHSGGRTNTQHE